MRAKPQQLMRKYSYCPPVECNFISNTTGHLLFGEIIDFYHAFELNVLNTTVLNLFTDITGNSVCNS